jgi:hypothetical protein
MHEILQVRACSVRHPAYLYEHMFPRLRQRIGTALIDRIDLMVEFTTLGEYALADDLRPVAMHADRPHADAQMAPARTRDDCPRRSAPLSRRCDDAARS